MSIIKVIKKSGKTSKALLAVLNYVSEKSELSAGINCSDNHRETYKEFLETKKFFNKNEGRQYRHYIQSFSYNEVNKDKALKIGVEWAKKVFEGYEVFVVTHSDRDHIHNHIIVNSVNFENGYKLHESKKDLEKRKVFNDEVCQKFGLENKVFNRNSGDIVTYDKDKYQIIKKGADITKLAENIISISETSISVNDFSEKMKKEGYHIEWSENKKHVTFTVDSKILKGNKNKFRLNNLNKTFNIELFEKEKLLERFKLNREHNFERFSSNLEGKLNKIVSKENKTNIKSIKHENNGLEL